jgi:putative transposase
MRPFTQRKWQLGEVYAKINGKMRYLWRAIDHKGEVLESFAKGTATRPPRWSPG